jgi:hypothetical protein
MGIPMAPLVSATAAPLRFPATRFGRIATFPYQEGNRIFAFHRERTAGKPVPNTSWFPMPLARPIPAPSTMAFATTSKRRQDRGTEQASLFGDAAQVSTPRVHCCTFLSIGRAIGFPRFRREQNHQHIDAVTPGASIARGNFTIPCGR